MPVLRSKDFLAGTVFMAIGLLALILAQPLRFGSASNMGAGFLPSVVSVLLMGVGLIIALRGVLAPGERIGRFHLRPALFVAASLVTFSLLLKPLGMVLAMVPLVIGGSLASRDFRLVEALAATVALTLFCIGIFVYALNLPIRLWP